MTVKLSEYTSTEELDIQFSEEITAILQCAIEQKGEATLVVSGGRTPAGLFKRLSQKNIAWEKVIVTLADERWVTTDDDASNEKSVRTLFLQDKAAKVRFISLRNGGATIDESVNNVELALKPLTKPFDVVILGMGDDGHTASLFPCADELEKALDLTNSSLCMAMTPKSAPHNRVTLTLPALLNSSQIYLHIVGASKKSVYQKAINGDNIKEMPVRAVLQQNRVPVTVYWSL